MSKTTIFVCTNRRFSTEHPSCGARGGGEELLQQLQIATKECDIDVVSSICFGHCTEGAVAKISPNGNFYHHVTELDIPMLIADANKLAATKPSPNTAPLIEDFDSHDID
ncbi:MAG: (2Fe-2S) ferredoxin domain-containing protein [Methylococcales bacterium]